MAAWWYLAAFVVFVAAVYIAIRWRVHYQGSVSKGGLESKGWTRLDVLPREAFFGPEVRLPKVMAPPPWHPEPHLALQDRLKEWRAKARLNAQMPPGMPLIVLDYQALLLDMLEAVDMLYGGIVDALFSEAGDEEGP